MGGWTGFTKNHLSPISERVVQNWMFLAKIPNAKLQAWMGEERLIKTARKAKGHGGDDPIGDFLKSIGIDPLPKEGPVSKEIKKLIDEAVEKPRPQKRSESKVNRVPDQLVDQLIDQLIEDLQDEKLLAKVDVTRLETLAAKIEEAMVKLSES